MDVWLVYRCEECDATWNRTIVTRRTPDEMGRDRYVRFERNDPELARACAFDIEDLRRTGVRVEDDLDFRVVRPPGSDEPGDRTIEIEVPVPCPVRLDRLLAQELGISRSLVHRWRDGGLLELEPDGADVLRRPVRSGQRVRPRE